MHLTEVKVAAPPSEPGARVSKGSRAAETLGSSRPDEWQERLKGVVADRRVPVHLVGAGNPFRGDDAAGLEIVGMLRRRLGAAPAPGMRIHSASLLPERILTKISRKRGRIVVFDAVEASKRPGEIVFCRMSETKHGFFATHNVPLKLLPGLAGREDDIFLVGIQPASMDVREGLTEEVQRSVKKVASVVTEGVEARV